MFKLTKAQANTVQELNWIDLNDHDAESVALYHACGTARLTDEQAVALALDMDFIVDRAEDELDTCLDFGEPRDRIGYVSRLRSMRKLAAKLARHASQVQQRWNSQQTGGHCNA